MKCVYIAALAWLASTASALAGELEQRAAICQEVAQFLRKDDFAGLDARYAQALAQNKRLASGVFTSNRIVRCLSDAAESRGGSLASGLDFDMRKHQENQWKAWQAKAVKWTQTYPASSLAAIALSEYYLQQGYVFRGYGPASRVDEKDMKVFTDLVAKAHEALNSRAKAGAKDSGWHYQMLRIARLQQWPPQRFSALLQQALEVDPMQYDIYFAASEMLLPQWGGSVETLENFADLAARRTRVTEGEALYARIYWDISGYFGAGLFEASKADWKHMRAGYEDMVKRYPDPWNMNGFAWFACLAGDRETLKRVLAAMGDRVEPEIWKTRQAYNECREWANETSKGERK
ncbi:MAG: hypothetical protein HYX47_01095 [Burkholderiales bacterium]|nr:hypothetical protein [Burkholderiales bacterium]